MEQNMMNLPECPNCIESSLKGKTIAGTNKRGHEAMVSQHHEASASSAAAAATSVAAGGEAAANSVLPKEAHTCACGSSTMTYHAAMSPAPLVDAGVPGEEEEEKKRKKARVFSIDLNKLPPSDDDENY